MMCKFFSKELFFVVFVLFFCVVKAGERNNNVQIGQDVSKVDLQGLTNELSATEASEDGLSTANIITIVCSAITLISALLVIVSTHKYAPCSKKVSRKGQVGDERKKVSRNGQGGDESKSLLSEVRVEGQGECFCPGVFSCWWGAKAEKHEERV